MTDPSVRSIRRADELVVGDWLAAGDAEDDPTEVAALVPYSTVEAGPRIEITYRQPDGDLGHWPVLPEAVLTLASAEEVAAQHARAVRARVAAQLVQLADLIIRHDLPMPDKYRPPTIGFSLGRDVAAVERVASVLGLSVERGNRGAEVWLERLAGVDGQLGVRWWADPPRQSAPSDPDPTGLLHSRADDADDPTPVSPARVPLHTGAMTDGGLVDETPGLVPAPIARHYETDHWVTDESGDSGVDCACGQVFRGSTVEKAAELLERHIAEANAADTVPVPAEGATLTPPSGYEPLPGGGYGLRDAEGAVVHIRDGQAITQAEHDEAFGGDWNADGDRETPASEAR